MAMTFAPRTCALALAVALGGAAVPVSAAATEHVVEHLDEVVGTSGELFDLYVPSGAARRTLLVFVHGGGFVDVDNRKETARGVARFYAEAGFVSATINYRLAPEHIFPAARDDVQAAVRWLRRQGRAYGYAAPRRIVLVGFSAGGNLALMAGLADRSRIAGIASFAGPTDVRALIAQTPLPEIREAIELYLGGQDPDLASPLFLVSRGDPRVLLIHGDQDQVVPVEQAYAIARRLAQQRVRHTLLVLPGVGHDLGTANPYLLAMFEELTRFLLAIDRRR
jgi:acetyl esterase/lipase